ncbi:metallophosphoesterase [Chromobacterium sp. CV08]|uniref:metallophosphoesterase n=1 Tax=Chromobacterium sp. CV08 TaxID=3133274 RepID=UPI003DA85E14
MNILQLTDLHLFAERGGRLLGRDTHAALHRVLAAVKALGPDAADAVLLTGDVSQDESEGSYRLAAEALAGLGLPVYWIAGNHDVRPTMERVFADYAFLRPLDAVELGGWTFIGVDSCVAGQDAGEISEAELTLLRRRLAAAGNGKAAVVLHHHPLAVGTPLLDDCMLRQSSRFWRAATAARLPLVICGHVHGAHSLSYRGCALEVAPATCFQWRDGACDIEIDDRAGYRLFHFDADGYRVASLFA